MRNRKLTASLLALVMLITLTACGGDGASDDPNLGVWTARTGEMMGLSMDIADFFGEGFIIELKAKGKCTLTVDGEKSSGTWTLENGAFTVSGGGFDGSGRLESGALVLENVLGMGLTITFEKEGGTPAATPGGGASDLDYFVITSITESGSTFGGDDLATLGMDGFYILLHKDGKADLMFGQLITGTWKDGKIDLGEAGAYDYSIEGDELTLEMEGTVTVYTRSTDTPPEPPEDSGGDRPGGKDKAASVDPLEWWSGDWYGYWELYAASEMWSDLDGGKWDCYAIIEMDEYGNGYIFAWDDDVELLFVDLLLYEESGMTAMGEAVSSEGYFWDDEIEYGQWIMDPGYSYYDDNIVISGYYDDAEDEGEGFYYTIMLRPWGTLWDDMPEDERPPDYDWWYLENYMLEMPIPSE